ALVAGAPAPGPDEARAVAGADGGGPAVEAAGTPGGGLRLEATGRSAAARSAVTTIVADTGVRFDVPDGQAAGALGVGGTPVPVDGGTIDRLPAGPRLDRASALVGRDGSAVEAFEGDEQPLRCGRRISDDAPRGGVVARDRRRRGRQHPRRGRWRPRHPRHRRRRRWARARARRSRTRPDPASRSAAPR